MPQPATSHALAAALAALALVLAACGGGSFEDRTAQVRIAGNGETYEVASCGRDGRTVFVVARAPSGAVLQMVMGIEEDLESAVEASTGLTIDVSDDESAPRFAAFGMGAWERRGSTGNAPGSVDSARLRGSRIQVSGSVVPVTATDQPVEGAEPRTFSVDARCDLEGS